jgi:hypothetical protein
VAPGRRPGITFLDVRDGEPHFDRLAAALREHQAVVNAWLDVYAASTVRVPRAIERGALAQRVAPIIEALGDALMPSPRPGGPPGVARLVPGSSELRDVEKAAALVGAGMASGDASGFDVSALMLALRSAIAPATEGAARLEAEAFVEWLAAVALDAFASARVASERERWREQLEEGTPVLMVAPDVPAAFLIGRPDARLLDVLFARLILLVVRVDARTAMVDVSGLAEAGHPEVLAAFDRFLAHPKVGGRLHVVVIGLQAEAEPAWFEAGRARGSRVSVDSHFDRAVGRALVDAGYRLLPP